MMTEANVPAERLLKTPRDFLRYAVSRFRQAGLAHGHGTTSAIDEAAYLILETLNLPIDDINPWIDARLLIEERRALLNITEQRITTRKPAAYLTHRAYIQGQRFYVDERVIVPRSFIGELMADEFFAGSEHSLIPNPQSVTTVLDLCTGSACLAILAAQHFPQASITAVDLSDQALEVAEINIKDYGLKDRIKLLKSDLFAELKGQRYDLIITNPPYVARAEVEAFPPEYASEPVMAHLGGEDGGDLVRRIIIEAPHHLNAGGSLLCEVGTGRPVVERVFPNLPLLWLDTEESQGEVFWMTV